MSASNVGRQLLLAFLEAVIRLLRVLPSRAVILYATLKPPANPMPQTKATNPIDKHVGSRVRMRRLMLDMSQTKLADALGVTFQQVQKYEKGVNRISASRLQQMSQTLQVPVAFFFEDLPPARTPKNAAASPDLLMEFMATSEGLALAEAFMSTPNMKLRRRIVDLVKELVGGQLVRENGTCTP